MSRVGGSPVSTSPQSWAAAIAAIPTGLRFATFTVAANDALDKTRADYVCDGVADNVQIQAAIAALPAAGGTVLLSEGTFTLAAKLDLGVKPVSLCGMGFTQTTLTLANGVNDDMILVGDGATSFIGGSIQNLNLRGNKANQISGKGIVLNGVQWFHIIDCYVGYFYGHGIEVTGTVGQPSQGVQIKGNTILYNGGDGINILTYAQYLRVLDNSIGENRTPGTNAGIRTASYEALIANNHIYNTGYFIYLDDGSGDNVIIANEMVGCESDGIWEQVASARNQIKGNRLESFGESANNLKGIVIQGDDSSVIGNSLKGVTVGANTPQFGIDSWGARAIIVDNHLIGSYVTATIREGAATPFVRNNLGYLAMGESRIASGALTAGNANAYAFNWQNPHATKILIKRVLIYLSTAGGTATSVLDVGPAAATATHSDTLIDGLDLNTTGVFDNINDAGANGKSRQIVDETGGGNDWVNGQILVANAANLVGRYEMEYVGI